MSSVSISAGSGTCWTQSGSTVKYESGLGPSIIANTSNGNSLVTSISGSIGSTSVSNNKCTYPVTITVNYSIPSGYSETSSSSGATSATIGGSTTVNYGGATKTFSVSKTIYYKTSTIEVLLNFGSWKMSYSEGFVTGSGYITPKTIDGASSISLNAGGSAYLHIAWSAFKSGTGYTAGSTGSISVSITIQGTTGRFDFNYQIPTSYSSTGSWSGWTFKSIIITGVSGSFTSYNYKIKYVIPSPSNNF